MPYYVIQACDINFLFECLALRWKHNDLQSHLGGRFVSLFTSSPFNFFLLKKRFKNFQNGEIYRLGVFYHPNLPPNDNFEAIKKAWQNTGVKYTHTSSGLAHYNSHCVAIRSVRTFWLRKLTAITDLHSGHFILMIPTISSGLASNNLLFLQHGQATCISCIYLRLPQEASQREKSN